MQLESYMTNAHNEMCEWRRAIHSYPETAFEEYRTSDFVAEKLNLFGVDEVVRNVGKTGLVAVIRGNRPGNKAIGLRAEMDALNIEEKTNLPHASQIVGKMHACGHDGHTTMLLGAARYLSETRNFSGTVYLVFQPAEETASGARAMIDDGLFTRFPMESIYAMHNWPGLASGRFGFCSGAVMAAYDTFDILVQGKGSHGACPHEGIDPVLIAAHIVTGLQTIASRNIKPIDPVVVSVTEIHSGSAYNVIHEHALLKGTVRTFSDLVQEQTKEKLHQISQGVASAYGATAVVRYSSHCPPTINHPNETENALGVAMAVFGVDQVIGSIDPTMGAEDFSYILRDCRGSYICLGSGEAAAPLHSPYFDFNDDLLPVGARYWVELVERTLSS